MAELLYTGPARVEIDDIWLYIAQNNPAAADRFIEELHGRCERLAENPGIGKEREEWGRGLRSFPHRDYLIVYRLLPSGGEGIEVIHVVHGRRDVDTLLGEGE